MIQRSALTLFMLTILSNTCFAHKLWILPSQTQFAGDDAWVTVDACASNDLFYFNHVPLQLQFLEIVAPDGTEAEAVNKSMGKYRSVFDVELTQNGTYRIALMSKFCFASWEKDGERKRWRGLPSELKEAVPADATEFQVAESLGRLETFVTKNTPTTKAMTPIGDGLEMIPVTHPNDLYTGEDATFRMLVNGEPREGLEVAVIRGGTRYRNQLEETKAVTNAHGEFTVKWDEPGMYWISTSAQDQKTSLEHADTRYLVFSATLEVLPE
ncbi:Nickel uptake substrate-specific transmembrane region [Thalassoglobus neptunius]|uniref:Nickel uptake substrate-specific transmembrane region n=1 Tax=Thalassoglobus neptunius TaxID=1938619 RepID=A0A5C5VY93_9PLAN|nr:Nickel uptake substrate-specific transmembrane region [Thalassoglobus neptunius]